MSLQDILQKRRSVRAYTLESVPREIIKEIIRAAILAPVSCNLQLTKYIIVDDSILLDKLRKKVSYKFAYSSCYIVVIHDTRLTINRYSGIMSAGMAVENMLLKIVELGLSSCAMAGFGKDKLIKDILSIPDEFEILLIISVGYADTSITQESVKKIAIEDTYSFNKFDTMKTINISRSLKHHRVQDIVDYRSRISSVYLDRFRLNTYDDLYHGDVCNVFTKRILPKLKEGTKLLDLETYDGTFLKYLYEGGVQNKLKLFASDYLSHTLSFFKKVFGVDTALIGTDNTISDVKNVGCVTFVFKAEFTPDLPSLISSARSLLDPSGYFFIAMVYEDRLKILAKWIRQKWQAIVNKKTLNIYENNDFYKIGAHERLSERALVDICRKKGLALEEIIVANTYRRRGVTIKTYTFRPSHSFRNGSRNAE